MIIHVSPLLETRTKLTEELCKYVGEKLAIVLDVKRKIQHWNTNTEKKEKEETPGILYVVAPASVCKL